MYLILYVVIAVGLVSAALYYARGPLLGMVITFVVNLAMRKSLKQFHLGSFSLLPFAMLDFKMTVCANRKSPEGTVSWRSFRILFDITKMFDPLLSLLHVLPSSSDENAPKRGRMISFVFQGFAASSPGLTYALFLDPPENKLPPTDNSTTNENGDKVVPDRSNSGSISYGLIMKRLMQHIVLFVDIIFDDFSFNFQFPSHQSHMIGGAKMMTISFPRPPDGASDTVSVLNQIDWGEMEIYHAGQRAMYYKGKQAKMSVDVHLPSGVMEVLMRILGRDHDQMYVTIEPFLEFYRIYANAEDNSIEIRMARGLSLGGKMSMRLECEWITVHVRDDRCRHPLSLTMQQLEGELRTYFLTRNNERMYKDRRYYDPDEVAAGPLEGDATPASDAAKQSLFQYFLRSKSSGPIVMSPNKDKVMKGGVKRIDFHSHRPETVAFVEEVSGIKVKRVFNENDFIDHDRMNGYAKEIHFEKIYPELLDWLIVLQDTANKIPDSRFAHNKNSEMHFQGALMVFSTHPVSFAYVPPPVVTDPPSSSGDCGQPTAASAATDPPLETLEHIPVDPDHWVCFRFREMVAKRELPHNEVDSLIDMKAAKFTIRSSLPQAALLEQYALDAVGDYDVSAGSEDSEGDDDDDGDTDSDQEYFDSAREVLDSPEPFGMQWGGNGELHETRQRRSSSNPVPSGWPEPRLRRESSIGDGEAGNTASPFALQNPALIGEEPVRIGPVAMNLDASSLRSSRQRKSFTGTCWTFPSFAVRMKLGLKMNLEWVRADHMRIDFLNSSSDCLMVLDGSHHRPHRHPFFQSTTLMATWYGPSVSCDLGDVRVKGSVAGMLKALSGFGMIRKTGDRVSARMAFIKARGARAPDMITHHVPVPATTAAAQPPPPAARTTARMSSLTIDVPVDISDEDHEKRLRHELAREQEQILRVQRRAEKMRAQRKGTYTSEMSENEDAGPPINMSVDTTALPTHSDINRGDKSLCITMTNFEYSSAVGESVAEFDTCKFMLNSYPERAWMVMSKVRYRKAVVPLSMDDAFYQGLDLQTSIEAAHITEKAVTELSMESYEMFFSARMELGLVADALLAQDAAYKLATRPLPRRRWRIEPESPYPQGDDYFGGPPVTSEEEAASDARDASAAEQSPSPVMLQQASASTGYSISFEEAESPDGPEDDEVVDEAVKPNPNTMHLVLKTFTVIYDAHHKNEYMNEFMTAEFMGLDLFLDATKYPSAVQDEITALDLGADGGDADRGKLAQLQSSSQRLSPVSPGKASSNSLSQMNSARSDGGDELLVYTGVFGGQLRFFTKYLIVRLKQFKDPLLKTEDMCFSGPLYNAAVKDDRIAKYEAMVALSDSVPSSATADGLRGVASSGDALDVDGPHNRPGAMVAGATEPLYVTLTRSAAPAKIYMDMTMSGTSFELGWSHTMMEYVTSLNAVTDTIVPPNKDASPLLVPWDMWRYLLHGCFSFGFDNFVVKYQAMDYMTQKVKLDISMQKLKWYMDRNSYSMTAQDIAVDAQLNTTALAGRRGQAKRTSGGQLVVVTRLCSVPAVVLSLVHAREDVRNKLAATAGGDHEQHGVSQSSMHTSWTEGSGRTRIYSHHDVYLRPALVNPNLPLDTNTPLEDYQYINNDRYYFFRSKTMSIRWEVELRLADAKDRPISFNVRLDHLVRVLDALKPAPEETPAEDFVDDPDACLDKAMEYNYGVVRPLAPLNIGDIISLLRLQLVLNTIMISSWPSATILGGFVMTIGSSDLQLRMLREIPKELLHPTSTSNNTTAEGANIKGTDRPRGLSQESIGELRREDKDVPMFPLVIDHLYMDTAFVELYVRNWNMNSSSEEEDGGNGPRKSFYARNSMNSVAGHSGPQIQEPSTPEEIQSLFQPIHKTAHSTKMVISLTENGVVCARDAVFTHSGILDKVSERAAKSAGLQGNNRNARISRRIPSGTSLASLAAVEADSTMFIIGKEWKEHLAKMAAASSQNALRTEQQQRRRPSAFSMHVAEAKLRQKQEETARRRTSVVAAEAGGRRSSVARRSSIAPGMSRARGRPHSDSMASDGSGAGSPVPHLGKVTAGNPRNRRSSIRAYRFERTSLRTAPWDPLVDGFRASLLSFKTNHSAFTPPPEALPSSYGQTKAGFMQGRSTQRTDEESSFGSKIWGLRITDLRLLFTIQIRDVLFNYFARGMDLFQPGPDVDAAEQQGARRRPTSLEAKQEQKAKKEASRATIYDFLQPNDKDNANYMSRRAAADKEKSKFGFSPMRTLSPLQTTLDPSSDPMLQFLSKHHERSGSPRSNRDFAQMMKLGGATSTPELRNKSRFQKGGRALKRENNQPIVFTFNESEKVSARQALKAESDSDNEEDDLPTTPISTARPFQQSTTAATPAATAVDQGTTPARSRPAPISTPKVAHSEPSASHHKSPTTVPTADASAPAAAKSTAGAKKSVSEYFFLVELIDPQVNFLDVKTHSSLIIVAGLSSLEGKRFCDATLPPSSGTAGTGAPRNSLASAQLVPKRQQELRLRMDGVSAFTVPSNSPDAQDDEVDLVHWKHMENTECIDTGAGYVGHRRGSTTTSESPFMRMAIKDFQIRAQYTFWTDVTVKEAKTMYLIPSKEELVCTFKLELPVIIVDILSWQFYVIMHVIRNVLLVPPPASASRVNATQSEVEEAEKNKVLELMRDPVLLAKHDLRANLNAALDLKHKLCRDELKLLIEENLAGAMMNMELGSARFVEVFVGSCTWILRMNSTAAAATTANPSTTARDWEKEQLKVEITGFHATFSYGEDRSASSLFEIQRFWAKDMDPGRDMALTTGKGAVATNAAGGASGLHVSKVSKAGKEEGKLDSIVMMPILSQTEHCARCGAAFLLEENHATACTFHANQDGEPGEFKDVTVTDELTGVQSMLKTWTCCGRHHAFAAGCSARPHTCKEVMIQIRAEANPTTRVENIDLSVLKSVDISIFPNSTYDLQVHITKSLADVLHKYFSIDDIENYEITANITDPPPEAESKGVGRWKQVRNVRRLLLQKKNKTGGADVEDDGSVMSGGELTPPRQSMLPTTPTAGSKGGPSISGSASSGAGAGAAASAQSVPTTPKTKESGSKSGAFSPWFRAGTPKRGGTALESSTHSDSTDSTTGASAQPHKGSLLGSLFGRKKDKKTVHAPEPSVEPDRGTRMSVDGSQPKHLKFNMMRARATSNADRLERRSFTASSASSHGPAPAPETAVTDPKSSSTAVAHRRQEGVYVKFLRLGGIQLEVSTAGFMLNLTRFKAQMDEFRCQGEVLQWNTLVFNMERHLAVSLFTNAASNSLSRFTQLFRFTNHALDAAGVVTDPSIHRTISAKWESAEDGNLAMSMKRSALGLPPSIHKVATRDEADDAKNNEAVIKQSASGKK